MFSYVVLDAIGAADANSDGLVDVTELAGFVDSNVPNVSYDAFRMRQIPQMKIVGSNYPLLNRTTVAGGQRAKHEHSREADTCRHRRGGSEG
ncbi:hypothetical protein RQ479_29925 [Mesorhizobium sp. ISC25]|uniref:hypothetical protein n=1 Tax=Mesorhizobium sp. ISC25 TaxID=3077335 RepID=UPI0035D98CBA